MDIKRARRIVRDIIADLDDRQGFHLGDVDKETVAEIRATWIKIIMKSDNPSKETS